MTKRKIICLISIIAIALVGLFLYNKLIQAKASNTTAKTYRELFESHNVNVSDKWDNYLEIYHDAYQKFIGQNPNVLEVGVQNGGSLQISSKYFINGNIYGVDIDPAVCKMNLGEDIKTYCFNIINRDKVDQYFNGINFDVILDDASHINQDIIAAFKILFPKLNPGGVYVIEDLHTSYWSEYEGGYLNKDAAIEYLKHFVDLVNSYHIKDDNFIKNLNDEDRYVFEWLESITFYDSVVVIKKLEKARKNPYKRVTTGTIEPVAVVKEYIKSLK